MVNRKKYVGKKMFINSTRYSDNEILDAGYSICEGVTDNRSSFKFSEHSHSNAPYTHDLMSLGCINTRLRSAVFIDAETIRSFIQERAQELQLTIGEKEGIMVTKRRNYSITVVKVEYERDEFTGDEYWRECILKHGYAERGKYAYRGYANYPGDVSVWVCPTLEEGIEKVIELSTQYFIEGEVDEQEEAIIKPAYATSALYEVSYDVLEVDNSTTHVKVLSYGYSDENAIDNLKDSMNELCTHCEANEESNSLFDRGINFKAKAIEHVLGKKVSVWTI